MAAKSKQAVFLEKYGWQCMSHKKKGMFVTARWWKQGSDVVSQETAMVRQRMDNRAAKSNR